MVCVPYFSFVRNQLESTRTCGSQFCSSSSQKQCGENNGNCYGETHKGDEYVYGLGSICNRCGNFLGHLWCVVAAWADAIGQSYAGIALCRHGLFSDRGS